MKKRIMALWLALALLLSSGAGTTVFATGGGGNPHGESGRLLAGQPGGPATPTDTSTATPQATDSVVDIGGIGSVAAVQAAIQVAINAAASDEVVFVTNTGAAFDAGTAMLALDIPEDITVEWNADYYGTVEWDNTDVYISMIHITGGGTFELTGGTIENINENTDATYYGNVLNSQGNITVSGGSIIAGALGNGIISTGSHAIVSVTGGLVSTLMPLSKIAIHAEGSDAQVQVSGGTVSSGNYYAISLGGENAVLTLSGNAAVSSTSSSLYAVYVTGSNSSVSVCENASITQGIQVSGSIQVSGGTISRSDGGGAVWAHSGASVSVSGGRLEGNGYRASAITGTPDEINISGGVLTTSTTEASRPVVIELGDSATRLSVTGGLIETGAGASWGIYASGAAVITVTGGMVRVGESPGASPCAIYANSANALVFASKSCVEGSITATNATKVNWDDSSETRGHAAGSAGDLTAGPEGAAVWARRGEQSGVACTLRNSDVVFVPVPLVHVGVEDLDADDVAAQINAWSAAHAGGNITAVVTDAGTVTVTGTAVDIAETLVINIPQGVTVVWRASISAAAGFGGTMVRLPTGGAFTVAAGLICSNSVAINGMTPNDETYPLVCKLSGGAVFGKMNSSTDLSQIGAYYPATGTYGCRTAPVQFTRLGAVSISGCVLMAVNTTVTGGTPTQYIFPTLDGGIIKHTNAATVVWGQKQIDDIWHNGISYEWGNDSGFIPFTIRYYTGRHAKDYFTYTLPTGLVANGSAQGIGEVTTPWGGLAPFTVYYQGTGGTTYEKSTTPPSAAGTYQVTVTTEGELFSTMEGKSLGSYTINPVTIEITTQPSDATVLEGTGAVLTTAATVNNDDTPDYTWFSCNSSGVVSGAALGTGASYSTGSSLAPGEHYFICRVSADNAASVSTNVAKVTVAAVTAPGTPTDLAATPGDGQVTLSWTTPGNGNSAITAYQYSVSPGNDGWQGVPESGPSTTNYTVTGLTNGTQYTFNIRAVNAIGAGAAASAAATPQVAATVPGTPRDLVVTPGDGRLELSWTAPANDGGSAITGYAVQLGAETPVPLGSEATSHTFEALTNGREYTVSVTAYNAVGAGPAATANATPTGAAPQYKPGGNIKLNKTHIQLWKDDTPADSAVILATPSAAMPLKVEFYDIIGTRRITASAEFAELPFEVDTLVLAGDGSPQPLTVTARPGKEGSALVRVMRTDDNGVMAQCRIDVSAKTVYTDIEKAEDLAGFTLDPATTTLYSRSTAAATIALWPQRASGKLAVRLNDKASVSIQPVASKTKTANPLSIFTFTAIDDRTVEVELNGTHTGNLKSSYKGKIEVVVDTGNLAVGEGGKLRIEAGTLTVKVNSKKPALKAAAINANAFYQENRAHIIEITGANAADITALQTVKLEAGESTGTRSQVAANAALAKKGITFEDGQVKFAPNAKGGGTLYLEAKLKNWARNKNGGAITAPADEWVPVKVSVKATNTAPAVKLAAAGFKVYNTAASAGNVLRIVPKSSKSPLTQYGIETVTLEDNAGSANDKYEIPANGAYKEDAGTLTVKPKAFEGASAPKKNDTLVLTATTRTGETFPLTARVSAVVQPSAKVSLTADKKTVTLNPSIGENYAIPLGTNIAGYDLSGKTASDYALTPPAAKDNVTQPVLTVSGDTLLVEAEPATTPGTYKYKLALKKAYKVGEAEKDTAALAITVKVSTATGAKVSLTAKGKVDLTRPGSAVTVTAKFTNYNGGFTTEPAFRIYQITGSGKNKVEHTVQFGSGGDFSIEPAEGKSGTWLITQSADMAAGTYYIAVDSSAITNGTVQTTVGAKFTVTASKPKIIRAPTAVTLYKCDCESVAMFKITAPEGTAAIDHDKTAVKPDTASNRLTVQSLGGGWYVVGFDFGADWEEAKSSSITLNIFLEGNTSGKKITTANVKVNVKK